MSPLELYLVIARVFDQSRPDHVFLVEAMDERDAVDRLAEHCGGDYVFEAQRAEMVDGMFHCELTSRVAFEADPLGAGVEPAERRQASGTSSRTDASPGTPMRSGKP